MKVGVNLWRALRDNRAPHAGAGRLEAGGKTLSERSAYAWAHRLRRRPPRAHPPPAPAPPARAAWVHLRDAPLTEADLPRAIEARAPRAAEGEAEAKAAAQAEGAKGRVERRPTVEVFAAEAAAAAH